MTKGYVGAPGDILTQEQMDAAKGAFMNMFGQAAAAAQQAGIGQAPAVEVQVPLYAKVAIGVVAVSAAALAISSIVRK